MPLIRRSRPGVLCALTAVACLVGGALLSRWIWPDRPEAKSALQGGLGVSVPARIEARSRNPTLEQLEVLGYVDATYDPNSERAGVVLHDKARTSAGYNLYTSPRQAGAHLIDMEGREIHRWHSDEEGGWQHAELLPNGDVLVIVYDRRVSRYDKNSNLLWSVEGRFHHDLWIHGDEIYTLVRVARVVENIHPRSITVVDLIRVLSLDGTVKRDISVLDAFQRSPYRFLLPSVRNRRAERLPRQLDLLHTNHVEVFDGGLADRDSVYAAGNVLLSARNINAIFILDGTTSEIVWIWGPSNLTFQHHPTLLENGNLLMFDNGLTRSRVIEIEPLSGSIVWSYAPGPRFFSEFRGSNQRLPNDHILITESDSGYVREITRNRDVVWEFANPAVNSKQEREAIWRMTRIDPRTLDFLKE